MLFTIPRALAFTSVAAAAAAFTAMLAGFGFATTGDRSSALFAAASALSLSMIAAGLYAMARIARSIRGGAAR